MKRLMQAMAALFFLMAGTLANAIYLAANHALNGLSLGDAMQKIAKLPLMLWLGAIALGLGAVACSSAITRIRAHEEARKAERRKAAEDQKLREAEALRTMGLQIICAQLITPNFDGTKALEWYLPQLIQTNGGAPPPKTQWAPTVNTGGETPYYLTINRLMAESIRPFRSPYLRGGFMYVDFKPMEEGTLFVTSSKQMQEMATERRDEDAPDPKHPGRIITIKVPYTLPAYQHLQEWISGTWSSCFAKTYDHFGVKNYRWTFGGATAGFTSLTEAFAYLEAHPKEVIWFMAADAPNAPLDEQNNEAGLLFLLAHPQATTGRKSLGSFHRPVSIAMDKDVGRSARLQHLKAAIQEAFSRGGADIRQLSYLFHDAGKEGEILGQVAQAMTEMAPDFDFLKQTVNLPAWLGDLRATTTHYNLLAGLWAAHSTNRPALVVGLRDADALHALTILPPKDHQPMDPKRNNDELFPKAYSRAHLSRPWWGKQLSGAKDAGMRE